MEQKISDEDILNTISDDMIYIRELVERERPHLNILREAHLGRIVVVFVAAAMESYRDILARILFSKNSMQWAQFFNDLYSENVFSSWSVHIGVNRVEMEAQIAAIKALRDIIIHGLTDITARNFEDKMNSVSNLLPINPTKITIKDIDKILSWDQKFVNLVGGGSVHIRQMKLK